MKFSRIKSAGCDGPGVGLLEINGVAVRTPVFMPVGTQGTIKTLPPDPLVQMGYRLILCNTYHLMLRPGEDTVGQLGGLQRFMAWPGAILTDSGGFQIFSLSRLNRVDEEGVVFRSHIDGSKKALTPESVVEIQTKLGSDIIMPLDVCSPWPCDSKKAESDMQRTHRWAARSLEAYKAVIRARQGNISDNMSDTAKGLSERKPALFGIVQGSTNGRLRELSASELAQMDFSGYGIGGLSVGEPPELMMEMLANTTPFLPENKPRYLMGVGSPVEMLDAISLGVDMFDCVLPTRLARHGAVFTPHGRMNIKNARYARDPAPVDEMCGCSTCRRFSRAYIRHLFNAGEVLGSVLASVHNLYFLNDMITQAQKAIKKGDFRRFCIEFKKTWFSGAE